MYVSHCTCGALSIALVVRCTPVARDKSGECDIPAPSPAALLGFSTAASSSPCEFCARRLFQLVETAADDVHWNGCRPSLSPPPAAFSKRTPQRNSAVRRDTAPPSHRGGCPSSSSSPSSTTKMPESDASWAERRDIYIHRDRERNRAPGIGEDCKAEPDARPLRRSRRSVRRGRPPWLRRKPF